MNKLVIMSFLALSSCATVKNTFEVKSGKNSKILVDGKEACKTTPCQVELACQVGALSHQEAVTNTNHNLVAIAKDGKETLTINACKQQSDEPILFFIADGPIYNEMIDPKFLEQYFKNVCGISVGASKDLLENCNKKWNSSFLARLNIEYKYADTNYVKTKCEAYLLDCNALQMEKWALESHQKRKAASEAKAQLELRKEANFEKLLDNLQKSNSTIYCTTNKNGFGGFSTYCN